MRTDLIELKTFLDSELAKKKQFNDSYSQKAFARDLDLSATALNEYLSGKRDLSFKNVDKVFKYINSKLHCSWCDKSKKEVGFLISGPRNQYICNECVDECKLIIKEKRVCKA